MATAMLMGYILHSEIGNIKIVIIWCCSLLA